MKSKRYGLNEDGTVTELNGITCSLYDTVCDAHNKAEAYATFGKMAFHALKYRPQVRFKNGAWQMIYSNGAELLSESGTMKRGTMGLCIAGGFKSVKDAELDSTFAYYASDEYQRQA